MPSYLLQSTVAALGGEHASLCDSRSLYLNRCAVPDEKDDKDHTPRKEWFERLLSKKAVRLPASRLSWLPVTASVLHARLLSRLMIGMSGGVMENAHLSLDRYGLPVLSGDSVKGCARRAALAALREWCDTGLRPVGTDNLLSRICTEDLEDPAALLTRIALTFGWVESDWEIQDNGSCTSDFAWACGTSFTNVWKIAAEALASLLGIRIRPAHAGSPWRSLPGCAGGVAFLPATPNSDPHLVLDVVTCHHSEYYGSNDPAKVATDTEEPVPVFFPAVQEQSGTDHFSFVLLPTVRSDATLLGFARASLITGLETFGIGAKTNAGYGWFQCLDTPDAPTRSSLAAFLPESELFIQKWGNRVLNGMSVTPFVRAAKEIRDDAQLLLVMKRLAPQQMANFNPRDSFWSAFLMSTDGKTICTRVQNALSPK